MNTPALLTSVSMRPKRSSAASMIRLAVAGSPMSPATVSRPGSADGLILRALATTAQSRLRYPATRPAPMPREAPVTMATLWVVMVMRYSTGGGFAVSGTRHHCPFGKKDLYYAERAVVSPPAHCRAAPARGRPGLAGERALLVNLLTGDGLT